MARMRTSLNLRPVPVLCKRIENEKYLDGDLDGALLRLMQVQLAFETRLLLLL